MNRASPPTSDTTTHSRNALMTRMMAYATGATATPTHANFRAVWTWSGVMFGRWDICATIAAFEYGSSRIVISTTASATPTNTARNLGFSPTRANTPAG